jgi:hypothetical protein
LDFPVFFLSLSLVGIYCAELFNESRLSAQERDIILAGGVRGILRSTQKQKRRENKEIEREKERE